MRLTLRNLLRFLDQTDLRSIERSRLEELVDESEKADAWIERIDALRRDRSTEAPSVECDDPSIDRVIAYLDSSMGEGETNEFERSMMASDRLLAEVASCHQVRESLRTESRPAISLLLRQSVYDLGRDAINHDFANGDESNADGNDDVAALANAMEDLPYVDGNPDEPVGGFSDEPDEPDNEPVSIDKLSRQARAKSRRTTVLLLGTLAGTIGLAFFLGWWAGQQPTSIRGSGDLARNDGGEAPADSKKPDSKTSDTQILGADGLPKDAPPETGNGKNEASRKEPPVDNDLASQPERPFADLDFPIVDPRAMPARPVVDPVLLADDAIAAGPDSNPGNTENVSEPLKAIATCVDPAAVLFRRATADGPWKQAVANEVLVELSEGMVVGGSSVELDLNGKAKVRVDGPARFTIGRRDVASEADVLIVEYGTYNVRSAIEDIDLMFHRGPHQYRVTLPVHPSSVTARFTRYLKPGDDPRGIQPASIEMFTVNSGRAILQEAARTWNLSQTQAMVLSESADAALARPPATGVPVSPVKPARYITRLGDVVSKNFPDMLNRDTDLKEQLIDLKGNTRKEVRFAAISWLAAIGNYSFLVDFLNEDNNDDYWISITRAVRDSITNEPSFADRLFQDLAVAGARNQQVMFDLLTGMSPETLADSGDSKLVELLDSESLGVRVLAIDALRTITDGITYGYNANAEGKIRRRLIEREWQRLLKKEEIRYKTPPTVPVPEFSTVPLVEPGASGESEELPDASGGAGDAG